MTSKLGKPIYSCTLYEKVKRATILLANKDDPILMVSFDSAISGIDHDSLITNGILPLATFFLSSSGAFRVTVKSNRRRGRLEISSHIPRDIY